MVDPAPVSEIAARRLAVLGEMAEVGLRLTKAFERHVLCAEEVQVHQAKTDPDVMVMPACDLAGVALAFNRVSHAVRMTLALQARLEAGRVRPAWAATGLSERRAQRVLQDVAADLSRGSPDASRLAEEISERLYDAFDRPDDLDRPLADLLAQIVKDLGLAVPAAGLEAAVERLRAAFAPVSDDEGAAEAGFGRARWAPAEPPD